MLGITHTYFAFLQKIIKTPAGPTLMKPGHWQEKSQSSYGTILNLRKNGALPYLPNKLFQQLVSRQTHYICQASHIKQLNQWPFPGSSFTTHYCKCAHA